MTDLLASVDRQAIFDRLRFVTTGARPTDVIDKTKITPEEYNALRWLAQLAANIVDRSPLAVWQSRQVAALPLFCIACAWNPRPPGRRKIDQRRTVQGEILLQGRLSAPSADSLDHLCDLSIIDLLNDSSFGEWPTAFLADAAEFSQPQRPRGLTTNGPRTRLLPRFGD